MPEKLTAVQAKSLRYMTGAKNGMNTVTDPEIAAAIPELLHTPFAAIGVTLAGHRALAEYDAEHREEAARARIAVGMSWSGRALLAQEADARGAQP